MSPDCDTGALSEAILGYMVHANSQHTKHELSYNRPGRLESHTYGTMTWDYLYDNTKNLLTAVRSANSDGLSAGSTAYGYDDAGRVTRRTLRNGASTTYDYDCAGRRRSSAECGIRNERRGMLNADSLKPLRLGGFARAFLKARARKTFRAKSARQRRSPRPGSVLIGS